MSDLAHRAGLPEPLKALLEIYPRDGWSQDPGFDALIQFWLDRHLMFRELLAILRASTRDGLEARLDPRAYRDGLARHGGLLLRELHMHHQVEDHHYFPVLRLHDARLEKGFDLLDADHHDLERHLHGFAEVAQAALRQPAPPKALGRVLTAVSALDALLDRHLTDEEDLIVPVLLKFGQSGLHG